MSHTHIVFNFVSFVIFQYQSFFVYSLRFVLVRYICYNFPIPLPKYETYDKLGFSHIVWSHSVVTYIIYVGLKIYLDPDLDFTQDDHWQRRVYESFDLGIWVAHVNTHSKLQTYILEMIKDLNSVLISKLNKNYLLASI